jgi:hypothetical protein
MKIKHVSILVVLLTTLTATLITSCGKDEENPNGSFSLTIGNETYTRLTKVVTLQESNGLLTFEGEDNDGHDLVFMASGIGNSGETVDISSDDVSLILTIDDGEPGTAYGAISGTMTRESKTKVTIDVTVRDIFNYSEEHMTGTIIIGVII